MQSLRALIPSANALFSFEAAARHGSFTKAATELGLTQAAVSFSVRQLEDTLGLALFVRSHRRIALTETGERFYSDVSLGLAHIRRSVEAIKAQRADRHVTLSATTAFASYWVLPRLALLRAEHPAIDLRLHTADRDVDLAAEDISLGIRQGNGDWPGYEGALLADEEIYAVCSPTYLATAATLRTPQDLPAHKLIHLDEPFRPCPSWSDWLAAQGVRDRSLGEGLRLNDHALVIRAALEGQGIAMGWHHLSTDLIGRGLLVKALPQSLKLESGFYVVWPKTTDLSADAVKVREWLLTQT